MEATREATVSEIMMSSPVTLKSDDILGLADDIMTLARIRHIPIMDGKRVVGILSQRDLFRSALVKAMGFKPAEQKDLLKSLHIREVMSQPVITVAREATVKQAARLMMEKKIGCLPVVEEEALLGLVTETDILRYVAER